MRVRASRSGDGARDSRNRRRHTPAQFIRRLTDGSKLLARYQPLEDVTSHVEMAESTWHLWQSPYGGMKAGDAKRLKGLELENTRPKKIVEGQTLGTDSLKERNLGNSLPSGRRR